jgi:hypothetical protein
MSRPEDTEVVKTLKRSVIVAAAIAATACVSWFEINRHRTQAKLARAADCEQRNALINQRVESLKKDAQERLKIGTKKASVSQFFVEHGIPLTITQFEAKGSSYAVGTLYTTGGCAPLGCGTNRVLVQVRVQVDADGTIAGEPDVDGPQYVDCV